MEHALTKALREIFGDGTVIENPTFPPRTCIGKIAVESNEQARSKNIIVDAKIINMATMQTGFDAVKIRVINTKHGEIHSQIFWFSDLFDKNNPNTGLFDKYTSDYRIAAIDSEMRWVVKPTPPDFMRLKASIRDYLKNFI